MSTRAAMSFIECCNTDNREHLLKHRLSMEILESNIDAVPKRPYVLAAPERCSFYLCPEDL
jgi:hypothetical protein